MGTIEKVDGAETDEVNSNKITFSFKMMPIRLTRKGCSLLETSNAISIRYSR